MMKIIVFEGGAPGRAVVIPGDAPEAELGELLGGETALTPLGRGLMLAERGDEEKVHLPVRYGLHRLGRAVEPIAGDCAVVAASPMGELRDIRAGDLGRANGYIWVLEAMA